MSSFFGTPSTEPDPEDPIEEVPTTPSATPLETSAGTEAPASLNEMAKLFRLMNLKNEPPLEKPPTPKMGGLVLSNRVYETWTGGKPRADWSGLVDEASRVLLPTQLRPIGSKAATSMIKRSESIFDDTKSKFKNKGDLDYFCRELHQFFKIHGLDTITYCKDPQDSSNMVSILTHYSCLSKATVNQ